jgi:hypothetical protein
MARQPKDDLLLWTIRKVFLDPLADFDISDDEKLHRCFGYPEREIYKRKILQGFRLEGAWWGVDLDKVHASRAIESGLHAYVREDGCSIDIEVNVRVWHKVGRKKKRLKQVREWFTCSIEETSYKKLDSFLGPREACCCKPFHKDDDDAVFGLGFEGFDREG